MSLDQLRLSIEEKDRAIITLISERMDIVRDIAHDDYLPFGGYLPERHIEDIGKDDADTPHFSLCLSQNISEPLIQFDSVDMPAVRGNRPGEIAMTRANLYHHIVSRDSRQSNHLLQKILVFEEVLAKALLERLPQIHFILEYAFMFRGEKRPSLA